MDIGVPVKCFSCGIVTKLKLFEGFSINTHKYNLMFIGPCIIAIDDE
jgi:hypothetical protein